MSPGRRVRRRGRLRWAVLVTALFLNQGREARVLAGVDPGERYGEEREKAMEAQISIVERKLGEKRVPSPVEIAPQEIEQLKKELLRFPKKKRFRYGGDFDMTYDSNPSGLGIHHEEGDTTFNLIPFMEVDLSGRHTDLRFEFRENNHYNVKRSVNPGNDTISQEGKIRFQRKVMKKTTLSLNDRLNRMSSRVQGIDDGTKVSWANSHRAGLSYAYNPKITLNFEVNFSSTTFPHENFDETSSRSLDLNPNLIFKLTKKTQISLGYQNSRSMIHTESSDATSHIFRVGYSGKLSAKSSLSADFAWTIQDPNSAQASNSKQYSTNLGYIWQPTRKTGVRLSYSNSFQRAISDSISGASLLKSTTLTSSDSWGLSTRLRLHRRIDAEFSFSPSHSHSKTKKTGADNTRSRTFTFPFQVAIDYNLARWLRLRFSYTYRHKIGDERKTDETRSHTWLVSSNVAF